MVSPTAATLYFYKSFWSVLPSQALETPQLLFCGFPWITINGRKSCWTWSVSAPKPPRPSPDPCWTWPGSAAKPPGTFSETFSGTLLNPTWLCTKASQTFSGTFSRTLLNLTWLCTKASRNLLRNLLQNLLRNLLQNLPRNLLRNPVEPDLALHQSLPDLLRNLRNLLRNLVEPDPAPAPVHTGAILGWRPR